MGITQLYPPHEFFQFGGNRDFRPGQFCHIVVPQLTPIPRILDVERNTPTEHEKVKFDIRNANFNDFRLKDRVLPIKYLNLRSHEELLIYKAKRRPGIILSSCTDTFPEIMPLLKQAGKRHLQEDSLFVIPLYSISRPNHQAGFPPQQVALIKCLKYRQFFYIPKNRYLDEGIARFDRIQTVIGKHNLNIELMDMALTESTLSLFLSMFIFSATGIEDNHLSEVRSVVSLACPPLPSN